jgi:uncharacterized protein (DUF362 family)
VFVKGTTEEIIMALEDHHVYCSSAPFTTYECPATERPLELPEWAPVTTAMLCLRALFLQAGLDREKYGSPTWNPLGEIICPGDRVAVKPNWVHHRNGSGQGLECLVTHRSVIEAILHYVIKAQPQSVVLCDAPIQACNFEALMAACRIPELLDRFMDNDVRVELKDLRRTVRRSDRLSDVPIKGHRPLGEYILYDLGRDSSLEPITTEKTEFRVNMYDPRVLKETHGPGKHQYLVARDMIDADVVINVPKLKTHKKACITGALKNVVGIVGNKESLAHHRKGGTDQHGDCYPGRSWAKQLVEEALDGVNSAERPLARRTLGGIARTAAQLAKLLGQGNNYDGSWYGNDTVWRMTLDLQRVLHYGVGSGTLSTRVQRKIITITDAIVAGEGEGPLSPTPIDLGIMTLGTNTPAVEWVHGILIGIDPRKLALTRESFMPHRFPLAGFSPDSIAILADGHRVSPSVLFSRYGRRFRLPTGWHAYHAHGQEEPCQSSNRV